MTFPRERLDGLAPRVGLALLAGLGALVLVAGSVLYGAAPAMPWWILPDLRPVLVVGVVGGLGVAGAFTQGARTVMLWTVVLLVVVFGLDQATVHWFATFEGTLSGTRLDPLRLGGGVVALGAAILLHADVAAGAAAADLRARGVPAAEADAGARALVARSRRRVAVLAVGALAGGALVALADVTLGGASAGPAAVGLVLGVAALAVVGFALARTIARRVNP